MASSPANQRKLRATNINLVGGGQPKRAVVPVQPPSAETSTEVWEPASDDNWQDEPTALDQYQNDKFAGTWKEGPITTDTFDLSLPEEKRRLNQLTAETDPVQAPRVIVVADDRYFSHRSNSWIVFIQYRRVSYLKLIQRPVDKESEAVAAAKAEAGATSTTSES